MKIDKSMDLFLGEMSGRFSEKKLSKYQFILRLFLNYLTNYGELPIEEDEEGYFILQADTTELIEGHVSEFLEWFLIRKVIGPKWVYTTAPKVMKRYIKWLDKKKLLAKDVKYEMLETIEKATKDLPRVKKAASLLYKLCDKNNEKFSVDDFEDENFMEGYGEVIEIFEDKLYLDYNGEKIGPVKITKKIAKYLKIGDTVNLAMGRKGDIWYPLESGFVYPRPLSEFGF